MAYIKRSSALTAEDSDDSASTIFESLGFIQLTSRHIPNEPDMSLMMSHILTCLGALIQVQKNTYSNESRKFYEAVAELCSIHAKGSHSFGSTVDLALNGYTNYVGRTNSNKKPTT
jgi:hypothetical protein